MIYTYTMCNKTCVYTCVNQKNTSKHVKIFDPL